MCLFTFVGADIMSVRNLQAGIKPAPTIRILSHIVQILSYP